MYVITNFNFSLLTIHIFVPSSSFCLKHCRNSNESLTDFVMGNCFRRESVMLWAGEDWGFSVSEEFNADSITKLQEEKEMRGAGFCHSPAKGAATTTTEVKIRITKKQLEELLGKVDVQGIPVEQVLEQLMSVSDRFETNQRSWRPALQSIPEIN